MLRKLEEWEQKSGRLPRFFELYRRLLVIQIEAGKQYTASDPGIQQYRIPRTVVDERLAQDLPVLGFDDLRIKWEVGRGVFRRVLAAIAEDAPERAGEVEKLNSFSDDAAALESSARLWYVGLPLASVVSSYGVDSQLLGFSLQTALKPILAMHAEAVISDINQENWRCGYCPVCSGKPDFASLEKESGARRLACCRCDTQWIFQRLQCPYCGNTDQRTLAYFETDDGPYRLYVCESCKKYIKAIDLRRADSDSLIPLERLLTADLDRQAETKGYKAGWLR